MLPVRNGVRFDESLPPATSSHGELTGIHWRDGCESTALYKGPVRSTSQDSWTPPTNQRKHLRKIVKLIYSLDLCCGPWKLNSSYLIEIPKEKQSFSMLLLFLVGNNCPAPNHHLLKVSCLMEVATSNLCKVSRAKEKERNRYIGLQIFDSVQHFTKEISSFTSFFWGLR